MWEDLEEWWRRVSQDPVLADAIIGQAGIEGNQALRETIPSTAELAMSEDLPEYGPTGEEEIFAPPATTRSAAVAAAEEEEKEPDLLNRLFLMSLMENMQGGDIGQAPAVVAGGGRREFPTMMRQFAPWEREKPYWWLR
jgi:hypothetical protein